MTAPSLLALAPVLDQTIPTAPTAIVPYGAHWAIDEGYAASALEILSRIDLVAAVAQPPVGPVRLSPAAQIAAWGGSSFPDADMDDGDTDDDPDNRPYVRTGGTAIVAIEGPLTKRMTCMSWLLGGTSTVEMRQAIRQARRDPKVRSLMVYIDSPGGQVAGTFDLADELAACGADMPTMAYISDLCASAAYAIGCMAGEMVANRAAMVGSIGTYMSIQDESKLYGAAGVKVHVIRAGKFKGAGTPGTAITEEQLAEWQRTVDELNAQFLDTIARGRRMEAEAVAAIADGRIHVGAAAQGLGLIDLVADFDTALGRLQARHGQPSKPRTAAPRGKERAMSKGLSVRERAAAFFAGLRASGAEMSEEDKAALASIEQSVQGGTPGAPAAAPPVPTAPAPATAAPAATDPALLPQMAAIQKQGEQLSALQTQMAEQIRLQQEQLAAARERESEALLMDMKRQGHLLPAAEEAAKKLLAADPDAFKAFLAANGKVVAMAPDRKLGAKKPAGTVAGIAAAAAASGSDGNTQVLADMAMERMKADKVTYDVALKAVARE
ncbi:MAG TPA: S49 family peptidase, partial [Chloroflexota bacterium]|nr:S49 family peptidase [Chloroflexota bacterium]